MTLVHCWLGHKRVQPLGIMVYGGYMEDNGIWRFLKKQAKNSRMIQQFHFQAYVPKKWKQGLE